MRKFSTSHDDFSSAKRKLLEQRLRQKGINTPVRALILPRKESGPCPLSFAQQRLWFLNQWAEESAWYNVPMALRLSGPLRLAVLERSLATVVQRHEILRTTFEERAGEPVQIIAPYGSSLQATVQMPIVDLRGLASAEREQQMTQLARVEARRSFDLTQGSLLRACLLWTGASPVPTDEQDYLLLLTLHHIICDDWSLEVLVHEMTTLYHAEINGEPSPLPPLPIQYADYTLWQRQWLQGELLDAQLAYWRKQLANLSPLALPTDHPRPAIKTDRGATQSRLLPPELSEGLSHLCQQQDVTLFMLGLATFQVLLMRYTGQTDLSIGTPIANRSRAELAGLIGFFVNTLVLRTDLSGNPTFTQLLHRVREVCSAAYAHQDIPFEKLVEEVAPERDTSRSPLFQVIFVLQNAPQRHAGLEGIRIEPLTIEGTSSKFDLALALTETEQGLHCVLEYSTDLFEADTITRVLDHWHILLQGVLQNPQTHVCDLPLLSDSERHQLLVEWNETTIGEVVGTRRDSGLPLSACACRPLQEACIHQLFEQQVEQTPDCVVLEFGEDELLTYAELNRRANQFAHYLQSLGVGPEVLVGICLSRSSEMVIALLAVLKAGGAYVPLDPAAPVERLAFMMEDTHIPVLLTQELPHRQIPTSVTHIILLSQMWEGLVCQADENPQSQTSLLQYPLTDRRNEENLTLRPMPPDMGDSNGTMPDMSSGFALDNLAYIIYTSGSTGVPKGVQVTHRGLGNLGLAQAQTLGIGPESRVLQFASLSFDASVSEILMTLLSGACLHLESSERILAGPDLWHVLQKQAISVVTLPPSVLTGLPTDNLPSLQTLVVAGEACPVGLMRHWAQGQRFFNAYGPTEATVCASMAQCVDGLSLGRPLSNTQIYLLDRTLQPVPVGVPGEIYLGGVGLARGYLHQPEATAEYFIPHPFVETVRDLYPEGGARLYRTGDMALFRSDGELEFIGRVDQRVKLRGYRIELSEIETILSKHLAVQECVVLKREAPFEQLVAYIVCQPVRQTRLQEQGRQLELWPSVAEFYVYDELLYQAMINDERRNQSYRVAARQLVKDKVVLDVGTGPEALLARMCVEEGARRVYAVELLADAYQQAKTTIEQLGLQDRIILLHGDIIHMHLPELVDVCVSEIVGAIGGAEGAASILQRTRRFLKEDGVMIPQRSITYIAAVSLPPEMAIDPGFTDLSAHYVEEIFEQVGISFDLRVCIKGLTPQDLLSDVACFEDLDFRKETIELEYEHHSTLTIQKGGQIDGFLVWLHLQTIEGEEIDILEHAHSWLPVYFPVFYPGIEVHQGERIQLVCRGKMCENGLNLDYTVEGSVIRMNNEVLDFCYQAPHYEKAFRASPFYQMIFPDERARRKKETDPRRDRGFSCGKGSDGRGKPLSVPANQALAGEIDDTIMQIRTYLQDHLPAYMIPATFVLLPNPLPLTSSGKVDRRTLEQELPASTKVQVFHSGSPEDKAVIAPHTPIEKALASIWKELLDLEQVSITDNFFEIGGHSLLAVQLLNRMHKQFGAHGRQALSLTTLFQVPTIQQAAALLQKEVRPTTQGTGSTQGTIPTVASSCVLLQRAGKKHPFFCVHPGPGVVYCFLDLAKHLRHDRPFYGIQAPGLFVHIASGQAQTDRDHRDSGLPLSVSLRLPTSIEEMATAYVNELLAIQPDGPYFLGGYSLGGWVAFEMAQQLQAQGRSVALLVILDTYPVEQDTSDRVANKEKTPPKRVGTAASKSPSSPAHTGSIGSHGQGQAAVPTRFSLIEPRWEDHAKSLVDLVMTLGHYWKRKVSVSYEELCGLQPDEQLAYVLDQLKGAQVVPDNMDISQLRRHIQINEAHERCIRRYRPQPYAGRITLFCCEEAEADPSSWAPFSSEPVEVHTIPGDHISMVGEPHVISLAAQLQQCLDKAETERSYLHVPD